MTTAHKLALAVLMLLTLPWHAKAGPTTDSVRAAGSLTCGVIVDIDDYSMADSHGDLSTVGADLCRAMAAEILGDPGKALFLSLPDEPSALAALRDGKVSVLFGTTPNPVVGAAFGASYGPPYFFDGQGFLVAKDKGIATLADLSGRRVCFLTGTPAEQQLYDALEPLLKQPEMRFPYSERGEMEAALVDGHCDAITGPISFLADARLGFHAATTQFDVMPETISLEPVAPVYRNGDPEWAALVSWTVWALVQAEQHGITQANADGMRESGDMAVRRLVGTTPWLGRALGVPDDAFFGAIRAVGNYGELMDRDVVRRLGLPRGRNQLASKGGLVWALPVEPAD